MISHFTETYILGKKYQFALNIKKYPTIKRAYLPRNSFKRSLDDQSHDEETQSIICSKTAIPPLRWIIPSPLSSKEWSCIIERLCSLCLDLEQREIRGTDFFLIFIFSLRLGCLQLIIKFV